MATGKKQYVYRLMKAQCSCGDQKFKQKLNLPKDHGVLFHDSESPLMNANDHVANEHIFTFGRCTSMANPNGAIGFAVASCIIPIIGGAFFRKLAGVKCEPMTIVPWIKVDEDYLIDGAPALTLESELPCFYGGVIKIVMELANPDDANQEGTDEAAEQTPEEEKDIKKQLPSEVQEKIDSFCDDEQTVVQSAGEDALAAEEQAKQEEWNRMMPQLGAPQEQTMQPVLTPPSYETLQPFGFNEMPEINYNFNYINGVGTNEFKTGMN